MELILGCDIAGGLVEYTIWRT